MTYENGKLTRVTDPDQRSLVFAYHTDPAKDDLLARVTDPAGRSVAFDYGGQRMDLVSATDVTAGVTTYGYEYGDHPPHLASIIYPKQHQTTIAYDCSPAWGGRRPAPDLRRQGRHHHHHRRPGQPWWWPATATTCCCR